MIFNFSVIDLKKFWLNILSAKAIMNEIFINKIIIEAIVIKIKF
jgi:hypothetical protein